MAFRLGAALRRHVRQQITGYGDNGPLSTSTRSHSTSIISLELEIAVSTGGSVLAPQRLVQYTNTPHRIVRSQCRNAQVSRSDVSFPCATRKFTRRKYSGLVPLVLRSTCPSPKLRVGLNFCFFICKVKD